MMAQGVVTLLIVKHSILFIHSFQDNRNKDWNFFLEIHIISFSRGFETSSGDKRELSIFKDFLGGIRLNEYVELLMVESQNMIEN